MQHYRQRVGKFGEELAKKFLIKRGYKIIDSNIKTSYKEIDIIAEKEKTIIFIEVKTRTSAKFGNAEDAIESRKIHHFKKAIQNYLFKNQLLYNEIRADFIAIDLNKNNKTAKIKHFLDII